jgi:oxygen-dependent protoporphyrinogen oxidase
MSKSAESRMSARVVVVGGGISGLAAAHAVASARPDAQVLVLEGADAVGGKLRLAEVGGVTVDVGAEALLTVRPEGVALLAELGLNSRRIAPRTTTAGVFAGGIRHPLPGKTMMGIPGSLDAARESGLFTARALDAIAAEPDKEPLAPLRGDVAVGALVRDRFGAEVLDRLVEPLLGGVYAGRADALSLRATMPALANALREGGSVVRAVAALADRGTRDPSAGPVFTSLSGGLGTLPAALVGTGAFEAIRRAAEGFELTCGSVPDGEVISAHAVVVAVPPSKAARLVGELAPRAASELAGIETASMAVVSFAFRDLHLPPGSGLLVAAGERLAVKGLTVSSQKWSLPTDQTQLRVSIGRAGDPIALQRDDAELIALARHELRPLLGITAEPIDALVTRWGGGLPQYAVGHVERIARIRESIAPLAGLALCGAAFDGVGIPACIGAAQRAAAEVVAALDARQAGAGPVGGR